MIKLLGHASVLLDGSKKVYIDPWEVSGVAADIILITHGHYDHCSPDDVRRLRKDDTVVIAPEDCANRIGGKVISLMPGERWEGMGVVVEAVPAYNLNKHFHPRSNNWVGYIVEIDGMRIYHAGDTDRIPEMHAIEADVALLPVGGTYTMTASEAALACSDMKVKKAVPIHYNKIVGSIEDAAIFKQKAGVEVTILNTEKG